MWKKLTYLRHTLVHAHIDSMWQTPMCARFLSDGDLFRRIQAMLLLLLQV